MTVTKLRPDASAVKDLLKSDKEFLKPLVQATLQEVLEAEMSEALCAEKGERTDGRLGYRSGYYSRFLITRIGKLELRVPQDRQGRFSTELFERYQRSEKVLVAFWSCAGCTTGAIFPKSVAILLSGSPNGAASILS